MQAGSHMMAAMPDPDRSADLGSRYPAVGCDQAKLVSKEQPTAAVERTALQRLIGHVEDHYGSLLGRLTQRLRSKDAAAEALHDAYIKLQNGAAISDVRHAPSYLYQMALNLARNRQRNDTRFIAFAANVIDLYPDDAPDAERIAVARRDLELGLTGLEALPSRRRDIFLARWQDGKSQAEIATQFRLHKRTVQKELFRAESFLRKLLDP